MAAFTIGDALAVLPYGSRTGATVTVGRLPRAPTLADRVRAGESIWSMGDPKKKGPAAERTTLTDDERRRVSQLREQGVSPEDIAKRLFREFAFKAPRSGFRSQYRVATDGVSIYHYTSPEKPWYSDLVGAATAVADFSAKTRGAVTAATGGLVSEENIANIVAPGSGSLVGATKTALASDIDAAINQKYGVSPAEIQAQIKGGVTVRF